MHKTVINATIVKTKHFISQYCVIEVDYEIKLKFTHM